MSLDQHTPLLVGKHQIDRSGGIVEQLALNGTC